MNAFDFRPADYGGKKYLSLNVARGEPSIYGAGIILSDTYEIVHEIQMSGHMDDFNQHEFSVLDDGDSVLYVTQSPHRVSGEVINLGNGSETWAQSNGIKEESLQWGREGMALFEWDCLDQIPLNESTFPWPEQPDEGLGWDYMHMNSIDKFPDGDYLVSMRYSNSLFRISAADNSIVWRMGGALSDFAMKDGFHFSRQHHARILTTNTTHTVLSLLDNAAGSLGGDDETTAPESAALIIQLHHDPSSSWTASILRRFPRPDKDLSHLRGSVQILTNTTTPTPNPSTQTHLHARHPDWPTSNLLVAWARNGYMTEFTPSGAVAAEARFVTQTLDTYRAYKHAGFVGRPTEPPALKAFAYGDVTGRTSAVVDGSGRGLGQLMTVAHVSWNGATEVRAWRVWGRVVRAGNAIMLGDEHRPVTYDDTYGLGFGSPSPSPAQAKRSAAKIPLYRPTDDDDDDADDQPPEHQTKLLGTFPRAGFETTISIPNLPISALWADALDAAGNVIGVSPVVRVVVPAQQPFGSSTSEDGEGSAAVDAIYADDQSGGFISLVKVPAVAVGAGGVGWGYGSVRGGGGGSGRGLAVAVGWGAGVGVGGAVVVLVGWWVWGVWRKGQRGKGSAKGKGKGRYRAVRGEEEEDVELVAGRGRGSSEDDEDEESGDDGYLGEMSWAPVFGGEEDEEMSLAEVRRGLAVRKEREQQRRWREGQLGAGGGSSGGGGEGAVPLIFQAKNRWDVAG